MKISEIAALAGVSTAAVSRYLNNGSLSDEKRASVAQVIAETGYQPDAAARSLRTRRTPQIGVIIPRINSGAVSNITAGITNTLMQRGYLCLLANTENNTERELEYLLAMQNNSSAGILLLATMLTERHERLLANLRVPCVLIGQYSRTSHCVYHDDLHAAKELAALVIQRGRKHLCYLGTTEQDIAAGLNRRLGVQEAMREHGLPAETLRVKHCEFSGSSGYAAMQALLAEDDRIDGVLCATDSIALGAMMALREHGLELPGQVSVTGFGDNWVGNAVVPQLSTAHLYYRESGVEASRMLLDMLEAPDENMPPRSTMLGYSIVRRGSI